MFNCFFNRKSPSKAKVDRRTVYIHIGISKTGTTAIQKFLHGHKTQLESVGIHYLSSGRSPGGESHHLLARIYKSGTDSTEIANEILREIADSGCHSFVISSEMFEYLNDKGIAKFKRDLNGLNLVLVVYLRYQDQAMSSMYNELVKKHACSVSFPEHVSKTPRKGLLLYGKMLDRWAKALGKENIRVRIFDRDRFYLGSLIQDFLHTIGVPQLNVDISLFQKNEAVSATAVEILAEINRSMSYSVDHAKHYGPACRLSNQLNRLIQESFPDHASSSNNFFTSMEEYESFMNYYNRDNTVVSRKYLGGEPFRSKGYVRALQLTDDAKKRILVALAEELKLHADFEGMSTQDLVLLIASYWSVELRRRCERQAL